MSTKTQILRELRQRVGEWVSGEIVSDDLKVTRSAIWKQINLLREEGYHIEALPKKGYRLLASPDLLLPDEISTGLNTSVFGQQHNYYFKEIESTNNEAKHLAAAGCPEGTIVIAEKQTGGRGRRGRCWHSPLGEGIYFSIILRPKISPHEASRISIMTAVAAAEALKSQTDLSIKIKWPNDILVNGKKVGGILAEISSDMEAIDYVVVGIGLNVNTPRESFPAELREIATSLLIEQEQSFSRIKILQSLLQFFEYYYSCLQENNFELVLQKLQEFSAIKGAQVRLDSVKDSITGQVLYIDDNGFLIIRDGKGEMHRALSGDVIILSP